MNSKRFLIKLSYLGFRYHGVQRQEEHQSVQGRVEKTLGAHFRDVVFTTRFSSRTDAMVSAVESYLLLMFNQTQSNQEVSSALKKLPPDIQIQSVENVPDNFTMLKAVGVKEYNYFFSHNESGPNVFAAPFMTVLSDKLDIELMKIGASVFVGTHNFENYCFKPKSGTVFERPIEMSEICENHEFTASFFPEKSYVFKIKAHGFMRGQVRLMMGALFRLGKYEISLEDLRRSVKESDPSFIKWMVPSSGLILKSTSLKSS